MRGSRSGPAHASGTPEAKRRDLFAAYVDRMFQRRSAMTRYTRQQTERWLAWLAWQMAQHSQTVFYLERMQPDWLPQGQRWLPIKGVIWGVGLGTGLGVGLGVGASYGLDLGLRAGLSSLLFTGLVFGLSVGEIKTKTTPNEGIQRSARMALVFGLGGVLAGGLTGGLFSRLGVWLGLEWPFWFEPLVLGLIGRLDFGGLTCLQHLVLRLLLIRNGSAPWRYAGFLDYATERIFLRKVGGGYIFIHRLLQDYFATRYTSGCPPEWGQRSR